MAEQEMRILAVAGDAGGAAALYPVLLALGSEGATVRPFAYRQAVTLWRDRGLACKQLDETTSEPMAGRILGEEGAAALLSGTSVNGVDLEKRFLSAARRVGVPSLAVLDYWANYPARFADEEGRLAFLPDGIAVMDECTREEMVAQQFPAERLHVTGQPAFDLLPGLRERFTPSRREAVRESLGVGGSELLVLFASQPLPADRQRDILNHLLGCLERLQSRRCGPIILLLRPHPREPVYQPASSRVRTLVSRSGDAREVALAADLVIGMSTILLMEASIMGCSVVSILPDPGEPDWLPANRAGWTWAASRLADLDAVVERALTDAPAAPRDETTRRLPPNATGRVVELVRRLARGGIGC